MRTKIKTYYYYFLILFLTSCAGTSELVTRSSRNLQAGESEIIGSFSLNPTIMPLNHEVDDTIAKTTIRSFGNYPNPMNPIGSVHLNHGTTNFYETGIGFDLSLIGYSVILNNKIGLMDFANSTSFKKVGISYYNKSSFSQGIALFGGSYLPFKKGHIETGNYLIIGIFLNESEFTISPHIDFNLLMSENHEDYYIDNASIIENPTSDIPEDEIISAKVTNSDISFVNYGLNIGFRTETDWFYEFGLQYISSNVNFYEPMRNSNYQFYFGIAKKFEL